MDFQIAGQAEAMALHEGAGDAERVPLGAAHRRRLILYSGLLLAVCQFAVPYEGLIGLPIIFFLKNRLGLSAHDVALFNLITSIPLFLGFVFGLTRDVWSPFRRGDRGFLTLFGVGTAAVYGGMCVLSPTYSVLLGGVLLVAIGLQFVFAAARGASSLLAQEEQVSGQASVAGNLAVMIPNLVAYFAGGALSGYLESRGAAEAARTIFAVGAGLLLVAAVMGVFGPRRLLDVHHATRRTEGALHDLVRLFRHRPLYPIMAIQLMWQFSPASGAVLQFHLANTLKATDAQVGQWYGLFSGSFVPIMILYSWLCRRFRLGTLLWVGTGLAVVQMLPLLLVRTPNEALMAAVAIGLIGGLGQSAYTDLAIRACPPGLQGAMTMMFISGYYISLRLGDLLGTYLYEMKGGFQTAVWATAAVYALILPMLLLVPKQFKDSAEGGAA